MNGNIAELFLALTLLPFMAAFLYTMLKDEIRDFLGNRKYAFRGICNRFTPKTPLQKEIKAERKEITKLRQHKRDMEELEELKKQKEQLWEDVHEEEHPTFKGIDPLPHLKNLQRNDFPADDFRYKAMKKQSEHFEEIIQEAEGEIDEVVNHYKKKTDRRDSDEI